MNKNVKIAKELVKLAKSLIADENVANKEGKYMNFTGRILWEQTDGYVENATFELSTGGHYVYWEKGIWKNGTLNDVSWENGTFEDGVFIGDIWYDGTWKNGTWEDGIWDRGTWINGTWKDGNWHYGTWKNGTWENGNWHYGTWENGTWKDGWWNLGFDKNDDSHLEGDSPDKW